ncbi:hypothetical protein AYI68_g4987, partial [Smittium mucronatum]
MSPSPMCSFGI